MKPVSTLLRTATAVLSGLLFLSGCNGGGDASSSSGTLSVAMTDAPACGYDHVFVTVEKVRVHRSAAAGEGDDGWYDIEVAEQQGRIDLLELTNGVLEELGQTDLPAGSYSQMRLVLADNKTTPMANTVVLTDSKNELELTTPSGQQSGLKMNLDVTVEPDRVARVVIDFDACRSVVRAGASGQYLLKPVLSVTTIISDAGQSIIGFVDTATLDADAATAVSAQRDGTVIKSTLPDASGKFVLYPVAPGTYDLVITSTGKATLVMTGVPVDATANTYVGGETVRIAMENSAANGASGSVSLGGSTVDTGASVRALQTPYAGPTVEVAGTPVDGSFGTFMFTLPVGAPRLAAYQDGQDPIVFAPDSEDPGLTAAGSYLLEASIEGQATQAEPIDVSDGDRVQDFVF